MKYNQVDDKFISIEDKLSLVKLRIQEIRIQQSETQELLDSRDLNVERKAQLWSRLVGYDQKLADLLMLEHRINQFIESERSKQYDK